jgi:hypothetical protein
MSVKERIKIFCKNRGISISEFEKTIKASNGYVNSISKSIGLDKIESLLENYPNISLEWLLIGKGEMLKTNKQEPINNTEGISQDERISKLLNIIEKQQDTINNQQEIINNLVNKQEKTSVPQDNDAECATA